MSDEKIKEKAEKILEEHIFNQTHIGSGDDGLYFQEANEYVNKQRNFWIEYGIRVIENQRQFLSKMIEDLKLNDEFHEYYKNEIMGKDDELNKILDYVKTKLLGDK